MKNNICDLNPLSYLTEVPIALYGEDSLPTAVQKCKSYKDNKTVKNSHINKKVKPKVDIHELPSVCL